MELMDKIGQLLKSMMTTIDVQSISILFGILGIAITIFTVIYSFMESTKERKRILCERAEAAHGKDPVTMADLSFTTQHLSSLWKMNLSVVGIIISDIVILGIYLMHMMLNDIAWLWYVALAMETVLIVACLITLSVYLRQYYKRFAKIV